MRSGDRERAVQVFVMPSRLASPVDDRHRPTARARAQQPRAACLTSNDERVAQRPAAAQGSTPTVATPSRRRRRGRLPRCDSELCGVAWRRIDIEVGGDVYHGRFESSDVAAVGAARARSASPASPPARCPRDSLRDAAVAAIGNRVILLGGLTAVDSSTDAISTVVGRLQHRSGRLPGPRHDAAAVALGGGIFVVGGGNSFKQLDEIVRFDPSGRRRPTVVGHLPVASSDAPLRWWDKPRTSSADIPAGGGSTRSLPGNWVIVHESSLICRNRSATQPLRLLAGRSSLRADRHLPEQRVGMSSVWTRPLGGSAGSVGCQVQRRTRRRQPSAGSCSYLEAAGTLSDRRPIASFPSAPLSGRVRRAGHLPTAISDLAAASLPGRIVIAGGQSGTATIAELVELRITRVARASATRARNAASAGSRTIAAAGVYAHDGASMLSPRCTVGCPIASTCPTASATQST